MEGKSARFENIGGGRFLRAGTRVRKLVQQELLFPASEHDLKQLRQDQKIGRAKPPRLAKFAFRSRLIARLKQRNAQLCMCCAVAGVGAYRVFEINERKSEIAVF